MKKLSKAIAVIMSICMVVSVTGVCSFADAKASYTKYAPIGDSLTAGWSLEGYDKNTVYDNCVKECYPVVLNNALGCKGEFHNLAIEGYTPREYGNFIKENEKYRGQVEDADLVTVQLGNVCLLDEIVWDYGWSELSNALFGEYVSGVTMMETLDRYSRGEFKSVEEVAAFLKQEGVSDKALAKISGYIPVFTKFVEDASANIASWLMTGNIYKAAKAALIADGFDSKTLNRVESLFAKKALKKQFETSYADFAAEMSSCVDTIRDINSSAQIVIIGYYNPLEKISIEIAGQSLSLSKIAGLLGDGNPLENITGMMEQYIGKMNSYLQSQCVEDEDAFVDISGIPASAVTYTFHANADGHKYIANEIQSALKAKQAAPFTASFDKYQNTYTGKAVTPKVTVKSLDGEILTEGGDYTVSYSNNKAVGKATVTISGVEGTAYAGKTMTKSFKITPPAASLKSVAKGKASFTAKWAKANKKYKSAISGYEIRYCDNGSTFYGEEDDVYYKKTAGWSKTSLTVKGLAKKKTYYVAMRTYKTVKGKTYYSGWSKAKSVKTK